MSASSLARKDPPDERCSFSDFAPEASKEQSVLANQDHKSGET